jgi:hypothetical protein
VGTSYQIGLAYGQIPGRLSSFLQPETYILRAKANQAEFGLNRIFNILAPHFDAYFKSRLQPTVQSKQSSR